MKPISFLLLFFFFGQSTFAQTEIVFQSVNVIPMDKEQVLSNYDVVVKNGMISAMGPAGKVKYTKEATVVNAKGKYLIPGLAEMHAHVPPVDDIAPMKDVLMLFAMNGVTTIRGMLGHPRHLELRKKLIAGEITGPRFYTSGPSFNGNTVKSPAAADSMVRQQKQAGYDFLKLHPGITRENFAVIVKTAKEVGIPFAGHVSYDVGVWRAIDAGYASIDHMDGFVESLIPGIENIKEQDLGSFAMFVADKADESKIPALTKALKEKNIWVVPTQCLAERWFSPTKSPDQLAAEPEMKYIDPQTLTNWTNNKKNLLANPKYKASTAQALIDIRRKLIKACNENGVGLLLGSDAPQVFDVPGFSVHHELKFMVDAGLSPYDALKAGTVNMAKYFNRSDIGVIKNGAVSDLVLLNGNPLQDINQSKNIAGVMLGNKWFSKEMIDAEMKKLEKK